MLVLTRLKGQTLLIPVGDSVVEMDFLEISRGRVRVGIVAPKTVRVVRSEIASEELREKAINQRRLV